MSEVKWRLHLLGVTQSLDDLLILTAINEARRAIQRDALSTHEDAWGKWVALPLSPTPDTRFPSWGATPTLGYPVLWYPVVPDTIPPDLISEVVVILAYRDNSVWVRRQCRKVTLREIYQITQDSFVVPTPHSPAYLLDRDPNIGVPRLYIAGLERNADELVEEPLVELLYLAEVPALEDFPDVDLDYNLPVDLYEAVIWKALYFCLLKISAPESWALVPQVSELVLLSLAQRDVEEVVAETKELSSRE
ncbi:MAG: hypothetical protein QXO86_01480 [Nitrososphaerota archaeon]